MPWRSRSSAGTCSATAVVTSSDVTSIRIVPGMNFCRLPWIFAEERRHRHEHDVVVVVAARRLSLRGRDAHHLERDVRDADGLADRIGAGAEQVGRRRSGPARRPSRPSRRRSGDSSAPMPRRPVADLEELGRRAGDDRSTSCGPRRRPARSSWTRGATKRTSATSARIARRSSQVSVGSEPAPALRAARRLRARRHDQHVRAHRGERLLDAGARALADRDHRDHRARRR